MPHRPLQLTTLMNIDTDDIYQTARENARSTLFPVANGIPVRHGVEVAMPFRNANKSFQRKCCFRSIQFNGEDYKQGDGITMRG